MRLKVCTGDAQKNYLWEEGRLNLSSFKKDTEAIIPQAQLKVRVSRTDSDYVI